MVLSKLFTRLVGCFIFCVSPECLGGVTILTHGFNASVDDWVTAMGQAVSRHSHLGLTNTTTYEIYFEQNDLGQFEPKQRRLQGVNPTTADSGEMIILLDWSQLSGVLFPNPEVLYSTTNIAPSIASVLAAPGFIPDLGNRAIVELPLHLVGHSRGGSLIYEISRLLGQQGIWVDHVTTLDPHPLNNDFNDTFVTTVVDARAVPYSNVLFADNYYQINASFLGIDPSGQFVPGAYNRRLDVRVGGYSGFAINHSNVHLWYHGTIDWLTPSSDSVATITALERSGWWTPAETNGVAAGYHYSLVGGGNRLSEETPAGGTNRVMDGFNQSWDLGAGKRDNRFPLPGNNGIWPNLLTLNLATTNLVAANEVRKVFRMIQGDPLPITLQYQYGQAQNTNLELRVFLDVDFNPYSTNEITLEKIALAPTGIDAVAKIDTKISAGAAASPGVYALGAAITDGTRTRYLYAPEWVEITAIPLPLEIVIRSSRPDGLDLSVLGAIGQKIVLEASSDVANWTPIQTNTLTSPAWNLSEQFADGVRHRFFRALLVE